MNTIALITGATSGIGRATAEKLAQNGYDLIITGRRNDRLTELTGQLKKYNVQVMSLCFDIRDRAAVNEAFNSLSEAWKQVDILVNNAGLAAGLDYIYQGDVEDWEAMIDTNVKGLLYMSRCVTPIMVARKKGHVINISSIAGKEVYEKGSVYCATKHAVDALTRVMRLDLVHHNIKVSSISPGAAETEFSLVRFKWDEQRAKDVYKGLAPMTGEDIAEAIYFIITRPPHINIGDMLITCAQQGNVTTFAREHN